MAFRFSLLAILRLRQSLERQEEQKLLALAGDVARLRRAMAQLEDEGLQVQRTALVHLAQGGVAAELQFAAQCGAAYERVRGGLRSKLDAAEARHRAQMKTYRDARQR